MVFLVVVAEVLQELKSGRIDLGLYVRVDPRIKYLMAFYVYLEYEG